MGSIFEEASVDLCDGLGVVTMIMKRSSVLSWPIL